MHNLQKILSNDNNDTVEQCVNLFNFPANFT